MIVVTGANGQVGRELCGLLTERAGPFRGLAKADLDITDTRAVSAALAGASVAINAAAFTAVDPAESEPDAAFAVNRDNGPPSSVGTSAAAIPGRWCASTRKSPTSSPPRPATPSSKPSSCGP
jgi:dTDP-4-dehydrorhamnose reductase